ncbi:MAG TPA: hypothetical protein VGC80_07135 [Acetobacteraceae bacterium]|jgi:hypothetical protein
MTRALLLLAVLALSAPALADEVYRGTMTCDIIPGLTNGPGALPFEVTVSGASASYQREIGRQGGGRIGQVEVGSGRLEGGQLKLAGNAATRSFNYSASYAGTVQNEELRLSGEQIWNVSNGVSGFHRGCRARLKRG